MGIRGSRWGHCFQKTHLKKKSLVVRGVTQLVECLPSEHEALASSSSTAEQHTVIPAPGRGREDEEVKDSATPIPVSLQKEWKWTPTSTWSGLAFPRARRGTPQTEDKQHVTESEQSIVCYSSRVAQRGACRTHTSPWLPSPECKQIKIKEQPRCSSTHL